jgi:hypothetical protein
VGAVASQRNGAEDVEGQHACMMPPPCRCGRPQTAPTGGRLQAVPSWRYLHVGGRKGTNPDAAYGRTGCAQRARLTRRLHSARQARPVLQTRPVRQTALRYRVQCCECQDWVGVRSTWVGERPVSAGLPTFNKPRSTVP